MKCRHLFLNLHMYILMQSYHELAHDLVLRPYYQILNKYHFFQSTNAKSFWNAVPYFLQIESEGFAVNEIWNVWSGIIMPLMPLLSIKGYYSNYYSTFYTFEYMLWIFIFLVISFKQNNLSWYWQYGIKATSGCILHTPSISTNKGTITITI